MPLCVQAMFCDTRGNNTRLFSPDGAILRLINLEAAKQICQAIITVLNALKRGLQPIFLHI